MCIEVEDLPKSSVTRGDLVPQGVAPLTRLLGQVHDDFAGPSTRQRALDVGSV